MSTRDSIYYGRLGHLFREMGDGAIYWEPTEGGRWRRLPCQFFWRWLEPYIHGSGSL